MSHPPSAHTHTIGVTGMTCEHCVAAVNQEITELGGVTAVDVQLVPGGVSDVTIDSEQPLDGAAVAAAIEEAGYAVTTPTDQSPR